MGWNIRADNETTPHNSGNFYTYIRNANVKIGHFYVYTIYSWS